MTISIVAILTTLAYPSYSQLIATTRAKSASTELYLALIKARSSAVKSNTSVTITPVGGVWQAGWQITDSSNNVISKESVLNGVTITDAPATVVYRSSGRPQATASFLISAPNGSKTVQRCVSLDIGGTPYTTAAAC